MSRLEDIEARLRELEAEKARLTRFGRDSFVVGDVIRWKKTYNDDHLVEYEDLVTDTLARRLTPGPKTYEWLALKTASGWRVTGRRRKDKLTYDELIEMIIAKPVAYDIMIATAWVSLLDAVAETVKNDGGESLLRVVTDYSERRIRGEIPDDAPDIANWQNPYDNREIVGEQTSFVSPSFAIKPENVD